MDLELLKKLGEAQNCILSSADCYSQDDEAEAKKYLERAKVAITSILEA